jgi:acyl carrier protein
MEGKRRSHKALEVDSARSSVRQGWHSLFMLRAWTDGAIYFFQSLKRRDQDHLNVEQEVRDFIQNELLFGEEVTFADDDSFLEGGIIDSTGILELVSFLESRYKFKVDEEELQPENLDSVNRLGRYVRAKCGSPG